MCDYQVTLLISLSGALDETELDFRYVSLHAPDFIGSEDLTSGAHDGPHFTTEPSVQTAFFPLCRVISENRSPAISGPILHCRTLFPKVS